jgi:multidrug resistance efflux pump
VTGLVEAAQSSTLIVPRLQGPGSGVLVVTRLAAAGTMVRKGDVVVQFDPQAQERVAFDRRAEYEDFTAQLAGKEAEHAASRTADESALELAKNAVERARLEMLKNEMLGAILVEKNEQTLAESEANLEMLRRTFEVKRRAERAERRALEIQRDRARSATEHAQQNIAAMTMRAPQDGLIVLKTVWKNGQMGEVQEGEESRPGLPLLDIVDPARMQVRARVSQADAPLLRAGQAATIELDAYPGKRFKGHVVSLAPAGVTSALSLRVRTFGALFEYREGDVVQPGRPVAEVFDPGSLEIVARIAEADASNVSPGQKAEVSFYPDPARRLQATVASIGGGGARRFWEASSRQLEVVLRSAGAVAGIQPGWSGTVVIRGDAVRHATHVPRQALIEKNGRSVVYVRQGGSFVATPVKVRRRTEISAVIEGVPVGAEVALRDPEAERAPAPAGVSASAGASR